MWRAETDGISPLAGQRTSVSAPRWRGLRRRWRWKPPYGDCVIFDLSHLHCGGDTILDCEGLGRFLSVLGRDEAFCRRICGGRTDEKQIAATVSGDEGQRGAATLARAGTHRLPRLSGLVRGKRCRTRPWAAV